MKTKKLQKARKSLMQTPRKSKKSAVATQPDAAPSKPGPTDREELELRAQGRAVLTDPTQPPNIIVRFCEPRLDARGSITQPPIACAPKCGMMGDKSYFPLPGESTKDFERRVCDNLPATGKPVMVVIFPEDDAVN